MGLFGSPLLRWPLTLYVLLSILGQCEMSIYPGLRRKPLSQTLQQQSYEVSETDYLNQLMEENARRRLQQQFEQQLELINMRLDHQRQREEQNRRRELLRERERYKQNQLERQRQRQRQKQQQQAQVLQERVDWGALKEDVQVDDNDDDDDDVEPAVDSAEYATTYTYNKNKQRIHPYDKYENFNYNNKYASVKLAQGNKNLPQRIPFAVPPSDPRYYINERNEYEDTSFDNGILEPIEGMETDSESNENGEDLDAKTLAEYEEYVPAESTPHVKEVKTSTSTSTSTSTATSTATVVKTVPAPSFPAGATIAPTSATFHRIKPPSAMAAAAVASSVKIPGQDINMLINKYRQNVDANSSNNDEEHLVVRHYMGMNDGDWGIYIVALIAGLSAAVTVGLIAIGFAWVHHKTKAAADVEYPAYGVTGPNRDISPSGDRKLAQSAQMYHYQHQKQQIMAMENRPVEGGMSDVESDDDNEEGDYTVYECPGLAPTGEMEVKNPLFLDETPVTTPSTTANNNTVTSAALNVISIPQPTSNHVQGSIKLKKNAPNDLNLSTQSSSAKKKGKK